MEDQQNSQMQNDAPLQSLNISRPIWLLYPQTGLINFKRRLLNATLSIANNQIIINSETQGQIINCPVSDIKLVKRWAPSMTFYFNDGSKLQIDFRNPRQNSKLPFGTNLASTIANNNYTLALASMKQFEDYFAQRGLLK